jgi:transglutaminase-like putative cysteine protease
MKYTISHRTTYNYSSTVHQSHHLLHLSPRDVGHQSIVRHRISINPAPGQRFDGVDFFGNPYSILILDQDHTQLVVDALTEVTVSNAATPPEPDATSDWQAIARGQVGANLAPDKDVVQYAASSRHGRHLAPMAEFARPSFPSGRPVLAGARDLMRRIFEEFEFDAFATDVSTPVEKVLEARRGVCQDFAHLMIAALRSLNLPARYVSGYILTHPPEGQERLQGADASHAWVSVWAPETGWVDFDPTNNVIPHGEHITIAHGRDYDDVCPISGVLLGGGQHRVEVAVDVLPVVEAA